MDEFDLSDDRFTPWQRSTRRVPDASNARRTTESSTLCQTFDMTPELWTYGRPSSRNTGVLHDARYLGTVIPSAARNLHLLSGISTAAKLLHGRPTTRNRRLTTVQAAPTLVVILNGAQRSEGSAFAFKHPSDPGLSGNPRARSRTNPGPNPSTPGSSTRSGQASWRASSPSVPSRVQWLSE